MILPVALPLKFLTYVFLGLQALKEDLGKASLTMLQSLQPPPVETILIILINRRYLPAVFETRR
jgi:hypothetical protein